MSRESSASVALLVAVVLATGGLMYALLGIRPSEVVALLSGPSYVVRTVASGAVVIGVAGGVLGSFAVTRGQGLLGDAVSHSALPGIYLAFLAWSALGLSEATVAGVQLPAARSLPVVLGGALATGLAATGLILVSARQTRLKVDAALGLTLATFFGAGIALRSLLQSSGGGWGNRAGLEAYLFGSSATMSRGDVVFMASVTAASLAVILILWKELELLSFDPDFLATLGFPARALDAVLTGLIVVAVIIGLQMVGVVLMSAMLIAPAAGARQWTDRFGRMVALAVVFGVLSGLLGVVASSARENVATGPVIALGATSLAVASLIVAPGRGLAWRSVRGAALRRQFAVDTLVIHLDQHGVPTTRAELGAALGWRPSGVKAALDRASSRGLVDAGPGVVTLTPDGRRHAARRLSELRAEGTPS